MQHVWIGIQQILNFVGLQMAYEVPPDILGKAFTFFLDLIYIILSEISVTSFVDFHYLLNSLCLGDSQQDALFKSILHRQVYQILHLQIILYDFAKHQFSGYLNFSQIMDSQIKRLRKHLNRLAADLQDPPHSLLLALQSVDRIQQLSKNNNFTSRSQFTQQSVQTLKKTQTNFRPQLDQQLTGLIDRYNDSIQTLRKQSVTIRQILCKQRRNKQSSERPASQRRPEMRKLRLDEGEKQLRKSSSRKQISKIDKEIIKITDKLKYYMD